MISGVVKNFVRGDRVGRISIPVRVVWASDPEQVRQILVDTAKAHEEVVGIPAPSALFMRFGDTGLEFELFCFVEEVERGARVKSDLHFAIFRAFAEAGVSMVSPSQPTPLDVSALEPLLRELALSPRKEKLTSVVEVSGIAGPESEPCVFPKSL
jgi:small-conductance mechanosensitive channel